MSCLSQISEDDLLCPVCYDIFTDPVLLLCSHSVCRACLEEFWSSRGFQECPVCRKKFTACEPPANLALRNVCETFIQNRSSSSPEALCDAHGEKARLFCLDDERLVCLVCRDSEKHLQHTFRPVDEVAPLLKEELKAAVKDLEEKLESFKEIKQTLDDASRHIKAQTQQTVRCLQEEFERLHRFLREEEMIRISALIEEENQKSRMMKERIEQIDREIESLSNNIGTIKNDLDAANMLFLQNVKLSKERAQVTPDDPAMPAGALLNVSKYLRNLKFEVWKKMMQIVQLAPVTLDPNTAHPLLFLTDDLTHVKSSADGQQYPDNPERFDFYQCVLGSEGFTSGTHFWDVEVLNNTCWSVGVTTASNRRKGGSFFDTGVWRVRYMAGQYTSQSAFMPRVHLALDKQLKVIRVQLDWDAGKVSFSDPLTNTHLCTFTTTFNEAIYPFLYNSCTDFPLRILPVKLSIEVVS
ncbi:zinc-binding protein A33-like [Puntigrus tetrazona]|uniref:zinc-binding protein A33-like n=1 Tax=Puntigrus tetrazona TaxID=1606681 RepID=UPI001C8A49C1|nr:zinc-binding protein A33-like [Puntigrus tetrazona]